MDSGTIGGQLGNQVGNYFEKKYGKKKAKKIEAYVGIFLASILLYVYFFVYSPISINELFESEFHISKVEQLGASAEEGTILLTSTTSNEIKINSENWNNIISAQKFITELKSLDKITIWTPKSDVSTLIGFTTPSVKVSPEQGLASREMTRSIILYISLFFYFIAIIMLIYASRLKEKILDLVCTCLQ